MRTTLALKRKPDDGTNNTYKRLPRKQTAAYVAGSHRFDYTTWSAMGTVAVWLQNRAEIANVERGNVKR